MRERKRLHPLVTGAFFIWVMTSVTVSLTDSFRVPWERLLVGIPFNHAHTYSSRFKQGNLGPNFGRPVVGHIFLFQLLSYLGPVSWRRVLLYVRSPISELSIQSFTWVFQHSRYELTLNHFMVINSGVLIASKRRSCFVWLEGMWLFSSALSSLLFIL